MEPETVNKPSPTPESETVRLKAIGALRVGKLPRQDSNLRPGDPKDVPTQAPRKQRRHLARGKSARKPRNAPESHPSDPTQTVPGEKERDG
jgi:hypothetical protein